MNFIVVLIISIIIFVFGVRFIYTLSSQATELQSLTLGDLDERIGNVVCEGFDRVCIGIDRLTIKRGKFAVFGIKILNVQDKATFDVIVSKPKDGTDEFLGYTKTKEKIRADQYFEGLEVIPISRPVTIDKNEEKSIGVGVQVPDNAHSGTYIFNVEIKKGNTPYVSIQKLYVDVP